MKIKTLEAVYTGGGIWIFWGTLEDGHYFLTAHEGWTTILTESPEDFDESLYEEWQEAHKVKDLENEELIAFQKELLGRIEKDDYEGALMDDCEIDNLKWIWELEEETAAESFNNWYGNKCRCADCAHCQQCMRNNIQAIACEIH